METRPITLSPEAWKWLEDSAKGRGLGTEEFLAYIVTYTRLGLGAPRPDRQPPVRYVEPPSRHRREPLRPGLPNRRISCGPIIG